ncbi:MAG TPA: VWA domain-containing protein, partial [Gemmatimonadaceae bacterium]|nr:VWA domain-containing protein [Gemmatimonadaceae bacterium]
MIRFLEWPWAVAFAVLLPVAGVIALIVGRRSRIRRLALLGTRTMLARLAPLGTRRGPWHNVRIVTSLALLGAAVSGPRWGQESSVVSRSGADVVLALDASLSMTATDERPSRLAKMKQVVRQLRALSPDDRFAMLAFAGKSYILTPLTTDDGALALYLDNLDPTVVGEAGSSMSSALRQATALLSLGKGNGNKAIVLMSDGEAFEPLSDVAAAAKRAKDAGIEVVTVGFGTPQGSTIPIVENGATTVKRDENGQVVVTQYHPEFLRTAADSAGGVFVPAEATNKAEAVRSAIQRLKTEAHAVQTGRDLTPRFQWFVAPALLLLLLDALLGLRSRRRLASAAIIAAGTLAACSPNSRTELLAYNRGTTLLSHDSLAAAVPILDSVEARHGPMAFNATFNAGWAYLVTGRKLRGDTAAQPLDSALAHYRRALTLTPDDRDAKWNYELAL